jgi:hypothetical protein
MWYWYVLFGLMMGGMVGIWIMCVFISGSDRG